MDQSLNELLNSRKSFLDTGDDNVNLAIVLFVAQSGRARSHRDASSNPAKHDLFNDHDQQQPFTRGSWAYSRVPRPEVSPSNQRQAWTC